MNELPGMGGVSDNKNFIRNFDDWALIPFGPFQKKLEEKKYSIRVAPMTGAVENMGFPDEKKFYFDFVKFCSEKKYLLSIGDGFPDSKLLWGVEALKSAGQKASVFIKPYPQNKIWERFELSLPQSESMGIDIDSYNILTMRNKVNLEKKTASQLIEIKKYLNSKGLPFIIKGVFTLDDIKLVQEVMPDVAYISNHGGRVETEEGSTAFFLKNHSETILKSCGEIWIDGGIRNCEQEKKALSYGVSCVLKGRPFIAEFIKSIYN